MRQALLLCATALLCASSIAAPAQDPAALVRQAVQAELTASRNDHSRWLYYEVDRRPEGATSQWVADTGNGSLHRVLTDHGQPTSTSTQRSLMERFIHDPGAQAKQRKAGQHDDQQSEEMLKVLPEAFQWSITGRRNGSTFLHFRPNPGFKAPSWETRAFAAMEGDLQLHDDGHRIVSLKGKLIHSVKFCGGLCGELSSGGTFDVERRETGGGVWQITETHVHIHGTALFFKNISQEEDDVKTRFHQLPQGITLADAESDLLHQNG